MPKFSVTVDHQLERNEAVSRLKGFSDQVRENSPVELSAVNEQWDDAGTLQFSFQAMGMKIAGQVVTSNHDVQVDGNLPFAAIAFRGAIETQIADQIRKAIT